MLSGGVKALLGGLGQLCLRLQEPNLSHGRQFPAMSESWCFRFLRATADLCLSPGNNAAETQV